MHLNCICHLSPAGHCIINSSSSIDPSSRLFHLSHFSLCHTLPGPIYLLTISHIIRHFKSIQIFILHPSIQFLIILSPSIWQMFPFPPFSSCLLPSCQICVYIYSIQKTKTNSLISLLVTIFILIPSVTFR